MRSPVGGRVERHDVRDAGVDAFGPVADPRQAGSHRRVRQFGEVADEHGRVTDVREPVEVLDDLGVVVGAQIDLTRVALGIDRQESRDVGQERVRRDLAFGILVQEVVDVPRLVAHPQVVRRLAHDVVEEHVVRAEDLVHPPESRRTRADRDGPPRTPSARTRKRGRHSQGGSIRRVRQAHSSPEVAPATRSRGPGRVRALRGRSPGRATRDPRPIGEHTHRARRLRSRANSHALPGRRPPCASRRSRGSGC